MAWIGWQVGEKEVLEKNNIFHLVSFGIIWYHLVSFGIIWYHFVKN